MSKKLALSDDEIVLGFILSRERTAISDGEIAKLYAEVLPRLKSEGAAMLRNVGNCGWDDAELNGVLCELPLEYKLSALVPCSFIIARNINDAFLRGGRAFAELKKFFLPREKGELKREIDRACRESAKRPIPVRKAREDVLNLISSSSGDRLKLRRRAALARTRPKPASDKGGRLRASAEETAEQAAKAIFPHGIREPSALAVRLVLKRAPSADRQAAYRALNKLSGGAYI